MTNKFRNVFCRFLVFFLCGGILTEWTLGTDIFSLPELVNPNSIDIQDQRVVIADGTTISIYSLKDNRIITKFGRKGEGPGEFILPVSGPTVGLNVAVHKEMIIVTSLRKLSYFSRSGSFLKDIKMSEGLFSGGFKPIGDRFIGHGFRSENKINHLTVNLYDPDLKKIHEILRIKATYQPGKGLDLFSTSFLYETSQNQIYIIGDKDFNIDVFDEVGKRLYTIRQKYKKEKITEIHKAHVYDFYKTDPMFKDRFDRIKKILVFTKFFPAVRDFQVTDDRMYVFSYQKKNGKNECRILDLKGGFIAKKFIKIHDKNPLLFFPYKIQDGKLFQLVANDDMEIWELHISII
jgi:hypothetical protein